MQLSRVPTTGLDRVGDGLAEDRIGGLASGVWVGTDQIGGLVDPLRGVPGRFVDGDPNHLVIVDDAGEILLYYRKMHPMVPLEPGDIGIPVCDGPAGSELTLITCHTWRATNQVNALTNLAYTASVALTGADDTGILSIVEAMICDVGGAVLEHGDNSPDRIVTGEVVPPRRAGPPYLGCGELHLPAGSPRLRTVATRQTADG